MHTLLSGLDTLISRMRMLTGLSIAYGTQAQHECAHSGLAQEVALSGGAFVPCERPIEADSLFDLASLTKLFTAVAAMRLVEDEKLRLDERMGDIDPRFAQIQDVCVGDILTFCVSLKTPGRLDEGGITREESLARLFHVARCETPAVRVYSDINAMVIKYVVEQKTGMPLYDTLNSLILRPAGMRDTFAVVPQEALSRCVNYNYEHRIAGDQYTLRTDTPPGVPHDPKSLALSLNGKDLCGHAGLFSTRSDMVRFAQALLRGEIVSHESLRAIGTNRIGRPNADGTHRQYLGMLCFTKHPDQHLSEVPEWMGRGSIGLSGFTGNHLSIEPTLGRFVLFLGNRCHNRVSNLVPASGKSFGDYGLEDSGVGCVPWPDARLVRSSAKYVYFKDKLLHAPICDRMKQLGWL